MDKKVAIACLSLIFAATLQLPSQAETVIERVARTGVLTAGTSTDAIPLAYDNDKGELVGYSVDMLNLIKAQLEARLGKPIQLDFVEITPEDRISKIEGREVDIICEAVSFTWNREQYVDFSTSYGVTGTKLLVKKSSSINSAESLAGKRVGVISETTNEQVIKLVQPQATLVPIKDIAAGFTALEAGKIDALAWDAMLLEGFRQTVNQPETFAVVPEAAYDREGLACMVPQNDSTFRNLVDFTLVKFMQGVVGGDSQSVAIFDRWFGPNGVIPVRREQVDQFFKYVIDSHEQISNAKEQPQP
ncbi:MAG: amino acid ABC transporter substrate-binding protein [Aphanocapsa sp. GSE-SYN-MK-11-07L]|jgi:polar amino acid transport system substrate-binding protein|nr:amino acid ABC transporter substrate-binding protein [Aphanocapsa sp. GSE-SYN-MK-11-07L]